MLPCYFCASNLPHERHITYEQLIEMRSVESTILIVDEETLPILLGRKRGNPNLSSTARSSISQ